MNIHLSFKATAVTLCTAVAVLASPLDLSRQTKQQQDGNSQIWTELRAAETRSLQENWQELRQRKLRLLPVPKQLSFRDTPVIIGGNNAGKTVIVLEEDNEHGRIAANEIISRLKDFSIDCDIPVVHAVQEDAYNIIIENKWPNTFTLDTTSRPIVSQTDQAYGLYLRTNGVVLAGQGEIGLLYAAVTLRWLITEENGAIVLYPANITDWPDYKQRQLGTLLSLYHTKYSSSAEKNFINLKKYIDWMFRLKATGTFRHTIGSVGNTESSKPNIVASTKELREAALLVNKYALKRGVRTMRAGGVSLGVQDRDKDRPGFDQLMVKRGNYHSWARHDLHRNKARNMAEFCRQTGHAQTFIHAVDSGGILDPENWSHRDDLTRKVYGNNRIQADSDMFNIYEEEMKKANVELIVVGYPYTADYLDLGFVLDKLGLPDTRESRIRAQALIDDMRTWMAGMNSRLSPDTLICIRESNQKNMFDFYAAYTGRPMWIYWEASHYVRSAYPLLTSNVRCIGSAFDPSRPPKDIMWFNTMDYRWFDEQMLVAASEYAWNTTFPGCQDYSPEYMYDGETVVDDQDALNIVAERAAIGWWGAEIGTTLKDFLASHLSWKVAVEPKITTKRLPAKTLAPLLVKNRKAAKTSCDAFDRAWEIVKQAHADDRKIMDDFSYPFFIQMYSMTKAAMAYANVHDSEHRVLAAIQGGDIDQALKIITAAKTDLANDKAAYEKVKNELKDEPQVIRYKDISERHQKRPLSKLMNPDFDALGKILTNLAADKDKLYEEYNVPDWFKKWFPSRHLTALKTDTEINIDGELNESVWSKAPPINQFVGHKNFTIMTDPAIARLLYDDKYIYLGMKIKQPLINSIHEEKRDQDIFVFTEAIEVHLLPGQVGSVDQLQFAIDTTGNLFTKKMFSILKDGKREIAGWDSDAKVAVKQKDGEWSLELAIPLKSIGEPLSDKWRIALVRNQVTNLKPRKMETFATSAFKGKPYIDSSAYAKLDFKELVPTNVIDTPLISVTKPEIKSITTTRGTGTEITAKLRLETMHPIQNVQISIEVLDRDGNRIGVMDNIEKNTISLSWISPRPLRIQLDTEHSGVKLRVSVYYKTLDGVTQTVIKDTIIGDPIALLRPENIYSEGITTNGQAFTSMAYFSGTISKTNLLSMKRGTIEFWINPNWDTVTATSALTRNQRNTLFHYGQVNPAYPGKTRNNALVITKGNNNWLSFELKNNLWDRRLVHTKMPLWNSNEWHHIACVWDMTGNNARMEIYLDGKYMPSEVRGRKKVDNSSMPGKDMAYAAQVGSLNSGYFPANAAFDNLIISTTTRYSTDFIPSRKQPALSDNLLIFPFNKSLEGSYQLNGIKTHISATLGVQQ